MSNDDTISEARLSLEEWRAWKGFVKRHFGEAQSRSMTNTQLECFVAELRALLATRQPVEAAPSREEKGDRRREALRLRTRRFLDQLAEGSREVDAATLEEGLPPETCPECGKPLRGHWRHKPCLEEPVEAAQRWPATDLTDKLFEYAQACRDAYEFIREIGTAERDEEAEEALMRRLFDLGSMRDPRPLTPQEIEHGRKVAERLGLLTDDGIGGQGEREGGKT